MYSTIFSWCSIISLGFAVVPVFAKKRYDGYSVIGAIPTNQNQLDFLKSLHRNEIFDYDIDFWKAPTGIGAPSDLQVSPDGRQFVEDLLQGQNIQYTVNINDLQQVIDEEERKHSHSNRIRYRDSGSNFNLGQYHSYDEITGFMFKLQNNFTSNLRVQSIGTTNENRPIYMMRISNGNLDGRKSRPAIWIDGGIHAREWISPATVLYFIDQLAKGLNSENSQIKEYSNDIDWYIVPVLNPDGYEYTRNGERMWRKNRSESKCTTSFVFRANKKCCPGTDLNRNFDVRFGEKGASSNPCSQIYHGTKAFSEPETNAVKNFIMQNKQNVKAFLSLHSYGQMWFYPYGYKENTYPKDVSDLKQVAQKAVKAIRDKDGTVYEYGTGADLLYSASGGSEDWAKETAGIKYSYLLELRPDDSVVKNGFFLPESEILPAARETWQGVKVVADEVRKEAGLSSSSTSQLCKDNSYRCGWLKRWQGCDRSFSIQNLCPLSCNLC